MGRHLLTRIILVSSSSACTLVMASASRGFCGNKKKHFSMVRSSIRYSCTHLLYFMLVDGEDIRGKKVLINENMTKTLSFFTEQESLCLFRE